MLRPRTFSLLAVLALLAGCVTPSALNSASVAQAQLMGEVKLLEEGGFEMEVPIHVYLLGFEPDVAAALGASLEPTPIDHSDSSMTRTFPPDPADPQPPVLSGTSSRAPTQPIATFMVHDLDAAFDAAFLEAAKGWTTDSDGQYDANAAEAYLVEALAAQGIVLDRANPIFVIMHAGDALGAHGWRQTFSHGYIENVRIFGEREPITIFDVSAEEDPYVVTDSMSPLAIAFRTAFGPSPDQIYNHPIEASGEETLKVLHELTVHAAHYRFLKGPIYPISTKPCHHVTLLHAVHTTSATELAPGFKKAADHVDAPRLEGYFENLTGDEVTVELKVLALPQDDPALDALIRGAGSFATLDALRWYLDENFDKFVTAKEGCEEYLSLLIFGDAATVGAYGGIGTYDVQRSHRISFSIVSDASRARWDPAAPGPLALSDHSRVYDMVNLLYAHETGHLFGQHHPQHLGADLPANSAFEGVYSVMSYQQNDRNSDFGAVDFATWTRGRVGYTIRDAQALDLVGTPAFDAALAQLQQGRWLDAHLALESSVQEAAAEEPSALPAFHFTGSHPHPWT